MYMPLGGGVLERIQTLQNRSSGRPLKTFLGVRVYDCFQSAEGKKEGTSAVKMQQLSFLLIHTELSSDHFTEPEVYIPFYNRRD